MKKKKALFSILSVLLLGGVAYGAFSIGKNTNQKPAPAPETAIVSTAQPAPAAEKTGDKTYSLAQIQKAMENGQFKLGTWAEPGSNPQVESIRKLERDVDKLPPPEGAGPGAEWEDISQSTMYEVTITWFDVSGGSYETLTYHAYFNDDNGEPVETGVRC